MKNIVLVGMPGSGKSLTAKIFAQEHFYKYLLYLYFHFLLMYVKDLLLYLSVCYPLYNQDRNFFCLCFSCK